MSHDTTRESLLECDASGEEDPNKQRFVSAEAIVIKHYNGFSPAALAPFLEQIRQNKGQSS